MGDCFMPLLRRFLSKRNGCPHDTVRRKDSNAVFLILLAVVESLQGVVWGKKRGAKSRLSRLYNEDRTDSLPREKRF